MAGTTSSAVFVTVVIVGIGIVAALIQGMTAIALTAVGGLGGFLAGRGAGLLLKTAETDWMKYTIVAAIFFVGLAFYSGVWLKDGLVAGTALGSLLGFLGVK